MNEYGILFYLLTRKRLITVNGELAEGKGNKNGSSLTSENGSGVSLDERDESSFERDRGKMHTHTRPSKKPRRKHYEKTYVIGSTEDELCAALSLQGLSKYVLLHKKLEEFSRNIAIFGLYLKKNILNGYWFLSHDSEIIKTSKSNPFFNKPRLAATLCVILSLCFLENGKASIHKIAEIRSVKSIHKDIEELKKLDLIEEHNGYVSITPNIGYFLDLSAFIKRLEERSNHIQNVIDKVKEDRKDKEKDKANPSE